MRFILLLIDNLTSSSEASVLPALCLAGVCLAQRDRAAVVGLVAAAALFYGAMFSGVFANHVDVASNFAGQRLIANSSKMALFIALASQAC